MRSSGPTKIKIMHLLTLLSMGKIFWTASSPGLACVCGTIAVLSVSVSVLLLLFAQSSLAQEDSIEDNGTQSFSLQNLTSQQIQLANESEFSSYISPALGIKIEHPIGWSPVSTELPGDVQVLQFNTTRSEEMQLLPPTVRISSAPLETNQSLDQLTENLLAIASSYPEYELKESVTQGLGNLTGHKVLYTYGSSDPSQVFTLQALDIWTIKDGNRYVFSYIAPLPEFPINLSLVEHMLDSLSFE